MTPQQMHLARALAAALLAAGLGACGTLGRAQQERVQYTDEPVERVANMLRERGVVVTAEGERDVATGRILSIYFRDRDHNLVEVSNRL